MESIGPTYNPRMPSSPQDTALSPGKRRRKLPHRSRFRKKRKRLDSICDEPTASYLADRKLADDEAAPLRRSSRIRRAPDLLDSSPVPYSRLNNVTDIATPGDIGGGKKRKRKGDEEAGRSSALGKENPVSRVNCLQRDDGEWNSRLRTRFAQSRENLVSFQEYATCLREVKSLFKGTGDKHIGPSISSSRSSSRRKQICNHGALEAATETGKEDGTSPSIENNCMDVLLTEKKTEVDAEFASIDQIDRGQDMMLDRLESTVGVTDETVFPGASLNDCGTHHTFIEESTHVPLSRAAEDHGSEDHGPNQYDNHPQSSDNIQDAVHTLKDKDQRVSAADEKFTRFRIKEGRRCGLCGCGSDGKPPKMLVNESCDSENEAFEGSTASEEPNYNVWDGFGGEPGWLGRLLGPMHDRFGIARVWVHQHCAVWSPEVYFANLGCLKNVRAALCRGRALKCSRCGRPGATIGCRVDRCPKTYHLPCSRMEGCIFDHRKFLIACSDHRRYFQPQGNNHTLHLRKMKAKKMRSDLRKVANEASRKDLDAEEKWLENCGEDEEFLKREGRRLHRDILRIAPIYIGGSSENEKLYQGWESVAGLEHVIQCMKEVVLLPLLYPEFFGNLGLTPPRGVLLHGYPGTGKTHVVRALIGACSRGDKKIAYFARKGADCLGKYVGDAERQLRLLFQVAERSQPSIIFFDEIDGLAPRRSRQQDQTHSSVVSTLLCLLDGLKSRGSVIVIGATNRPDSIDPALRRPGRFDREIYFPLPSEKDRSSILSLHTRSWPNPLSGSLLSWIANQTVGYAGADLQALCALAAMQALKRNCALQQLLSFAAKGTVQGNLPGLPSVKVEERDWLEALTLAPPPCSRREAGIAVNDIVASPLPAHLISSFILPLSHLLVLLCMDERIWLTPLLLKASMFVKRVIVLDLQQKGLPVSVWSSHLHYLIRGPFIAEKIGSKFTRCGLSSSGFSYPFIFDGEDDESDEIENNDSLGMKTSPSYMHKNLMLNCPLQVGRTLGFRTLISGAPRSGQQHLASCLLQGFMGHVEIQKVSLATISQEGHGDMIYGLTQILLKCMNVGRCIIYMPRIDLWALDENAGTNASGNQVNPEICLSMSEKGTARQKGVSEMWNSFVEQVDSVITSATLTIVATCELEKANLPHGLIRFFSSDLHNHTESTIPRFFIHVDGKLDLELVISSAAKQLSNDLVQHYLKLMHETTHVQHSEDTHADISSDVNLSIESERITFNGAVSCVIDLKYEGTNISSFPHTYGDRIASQRYSAQDSFPRTGKVPKGNLSLAIASFGYQILRYPQFAELIWVTSKLKEGPCADISGPWKRWPFNTCVMDAECSPDKKVSGVNDMVFPGVVRGLIAVGLRAYRGLYTSVSEVSADVRMVLELLVGQIRMKLFGRKDSYCNFRVLSQVAYLDDMVNSWGYMLESLQADNSITEINSNPVGRLQSEPTTTVGLNLSNNQSTIQIHANNCNLVPNISRDFGSNCQLPNSSINLGHIHPSIASQELTNGVAPTSEASLSNTPDQIPDSVPNEKTNLIESGTSEKSTVLDSLLCSNQMGFFPNHHLPQVSCLYNCCSNCVHMITVLSRKMISSYFKADGCYSLEDAHDIITAGSLTILASFKRECIFQRKLNCQTPSEGHHGDGCKEMEKIEFLPADCECHTRAESSSCSLLDSKLACFFRDGVLVPSVSSYDSELHCNFEKLCLCSLVRILLTIEPALNH